jgi:hypothetical protein
MKKWLFRLLLWLPALPTYADLPEMEDDLTHVMWTRL